MQGHWQTTRQDGEEQSKDLDLDGAGVPTGTADGAEVYAPDRGSCQGRVALRAVATRWRRLERWLLRSACQLCGAVQDDVVCAGCAADVVPQVSRCARCAVPLGRRAADLAAGAGATCLSCRLTPPAFDATLALGDYAPPQDGLVLALKFGAALPLAHWFAAALAARWRATGRRAPQWIVPVPLAHGRLAERGFNQAWEIARRLGRELGVPASADWLVRPRETAAQSTLDIGQRHANMAGAFAVAACARVTGLHIGLVDDVMTTGATLADAACALKRHGAARVTAIVALRTP